MASLVCSVYSFNTLTGTWKHLTCTSQSDYVKPPVKTKTRTSGPCSTGQSYRIGGQSERTVLDILDPTMEV